MCQSRGNQDQPRNCAGALLGVVCQEQSVIKWLIKAVRY